MHTNSQTPSCSSPRPRRAPCSIQSLYRMRGYRYYQRPLILLPPTSLVLLAQIFSAASAMLSLAHATSPQSQHAHHCSIIPTSLSNVCYISKLTFPPYLSSSSPFHLTRLSDTRLVHRPRISSTIVAAFPIYSSPINTKSMSPLSQGQPTHARSLYSPLTWTHVSADGCPLLSDLVLLAPPPPRLIHTQHTHMLLLDISLCSVNRLGISLSSTGTSVVV
jgi:hypothetical protein